MLSERRRGLTSTRLVGEGQEELVADASRCIDEDPLLRTSPRRGKIRPVTPLRLGVRSKLEGLGRVGWCGNRGCRLAARFGVEAAAGEQRVGLLAPPPWVRLALELRPLPVEQTVRSLQVDCTVRGLVALREEVVDELPV